MRISGTPGYITHALSKLCPTLTTATVFTARYAGMYRAQLLPWQAAALYALALPYDRKGARILEIGTAGGFSAAIMALAAPQAQITTLNPRGDEVEDARKRLDVYTNIITLPVASWDYLTTFRGPAFDMVFVDGDHKQVARDVPWFNWIHPGGLMLCHDYSPTQSAHACAPVYETVNVMVAQLKRPLDVLVADDKLAGMAGFYRQKREVIGG